VADIVRELQKKERVEQAASAEDAHLILEVQGRVRRGPGNMGACVTLTLSAGPGLDPGVAKQMSFRRADYWKWSPAFHSEDRSHVGMEFCEANWDRTGKTIATALDGELRREENHGLILANSTEAR
jgi:hypothetical protein